MIHIALLAAPAFDLSLIKLIFVVIAVIVWGFNRLVAVLGNNKVPPAARRPPARRPPDVLAGKPPAAPAQRPSDSLAGEIEQFLREAAQRKEKSAQRLATGRATPVPERPTGLPRPNSLPRPTVARLVAGEPIDAELVEPPTGDSVSESVNRHMDTGAFAQRASNLAGDMKRADVQREKHFKKTFDHKLGRLTDTSQSEADNAAEIAEAQNTPTGATALIKMLVSPESLRQAIVLNEILTRPESRW